MPGSIAGELALVAYVVAGGDADTSQDDWRDALRAELSDAMIPSAFETLEITVVDPGMGEVSIEIAEVGGEFQACAGETVQITAQITTGDISNVQDVYVAIVADDIILRDSQVHFQQIPARTYYGARLNGTTRITFELADGTPLAGMEVMAVPGSWASLIARDRRHAPFVHGGSLVHNSAPFCGNRFFHTPSCSLLSKIKDK